MRTRLAAAAALAVFLVSPLAVSTASAAPATGTTPVGPVVVDRPAGGYGFPGDWCEAFPWWPTCD